MTIRATPCPALRRKLRRLASDLRFEDAARLRDRITAVEQVAERLDELARARALRACLVVPALEPGMVRAVFVAAAVRRPAHGPARRRRRARDRGRAGRGSRALGAQGGSRRSLAAVVDELLLVASFLRRPPPELRVVALEREAVMAAVNGVALAA